MEVCFYEGCSKQSEVLCKCSQEGFYYCKDHLKQHLVTGKDHEIQELFFDISASTKHFILSKCLGSIKKCQNIKSKLLKNAKEFYLAVEILQNKIYRQIKTAENKYRAIVSALDKCDRVRTREEPEFIEKVILRNTGTGNYSWEDWEINENLYQMSFLELEKVKKNLENKKTIQDLLDEQTPIPEPIEPDTLKKFMYFFKPSTSDLIEINLHTHNFSSKRLKDSNPIGSKAIICPISETEYFVYGGGERSIRDGYILSTLNLSLTPKVSSTPRHSAGSVYCNEKVYIFGGHNTEKILDTAAAFNLGTNRWETLAPMPSPSSCTSSGVLKSVMPVIGFHMDKLYLYNWHTNMYTIGNDAFILNSHKILCCDDNSMHVICNKELRFTANLKDWETFSLAKNSLPDKWGLMSCVVHKSYYFYFLYNDWVLRRLDTKKKIVEQVANIKL
jgi:Kelch motif